MNWSLKLPSTSLKGFVVTGLKQLLIQPWSGKKIHCVDLELRKLLWSKNLIGTSEEVDHFKYAGDVLYISGTRKWHVVVAPWDNIIKTNIPDTWHMVGSAGKHVYFYRDRQVIRVDRASGVQVAFSNGQKKHNASDITANTAYHGKYIGSDGRGANYLVPLEMLGQPEHGITPLPAGLIKHMAIHDLGIFLAFDGSCGIAEVNGVLLDWDGNVLVEFVGCEPLEQFFNAISSMKLLRVDSEWLLLGLAKDSKQEDHYVHSCFSLRESRTLWYHSLPVSHHEYQHKHYYVSRYSGYHDGRGVYPEKRAGWLRFINLLSGEVRHETSVNAQCGVIPYGDGLLCLGGDKYLRYTDELV